jgi:hypothetical protein
VVTFTVGGGGGGGAGRFWLQAIRALMRLNAAPKKIVVHSNERRAGRGRIRGSLEQWSLLLPVARNVP